MALPEQEASSTKKPLLLERLYLYFGGDKEKWEQVCRLRKRGFLLCFLPFILTPVVFLIYPNPLTLTLGILAISIGLFVYTIMGIREGVFLSFGFVLVEKNKRPFSFWIEVVVNLFASAFFFLVGLWLLFGWLSHL